MGMSASQANLLTLTARLHDIEYKAENIESQKIQLATQREELFEDYSNKLDAKKIQVAMGINNGVYKYVDATYKNLCTYNSSMQQQYALRMADTGKVIVPEEVYDVYKNQGFDNDKYAFAWAMLGLSGNFSWSEDGYGGLQGLAAGVQTDESGGTWETLMESEGAATNLLMTDVEKIVYDENCSNDNLLKAYFDTFEKASQEGNNVTTYDAFNTFRNYLYSNFGKEIYQYMILDKSDENNTDINGLVDSGFRGIDWAEVQDEFNYYTRLFDEIKNAGGCVSIDSVSDGNTGNDWINSMVNSGRILIEMWVDNKNGWQETSVATSYSNNYLQEVSDDNGLKKAEAEYEYELGIINQKDSRFDKELSKLETERNAIQTEMESIEQVEKDNVERTFGIFS